MLCCADCVLAAPCCAVLCCVDLYLQHTALLHCTQLHRTQLHCTHPPTPQVEGVRFLYEAIMGLRSPGMSGAILADEMVGLGMEGLGLQGMGL